jgi:hypothetical protein
VTRRTDRPGRLPDPEPGVTVRLGDGRYDVYAPPGTHAGEYVLALARLVPHDAELDEATGGTGDGEILVTFRSAPPAGKGGGRA